MLNVSEALVRQFGGCEQILVVDTLNDDFWTRDSKARRIAKPYLLARKHTISVRGSSNVLEELQQEMIGILKEKY